MKCVLFSLCTSVPTSEDIDEQRNDLDTKQLTVQTRMVKQKQDSNGTNPHGNRECHQVDGTLYSLKLNVF